MRFLAVVRQEGAVVVIFVAALVVRLFFLSPWLEDWDSVQFAIALHNYSILEHLPHPPGYPLYVLLGKLFYLFFKNDTQALTVLSALLGSLSTIPLYFLAKKMFGKQVASVSALLFVLIPISWILSEAALTNIPGLFFLLVIIYLMYSFADRTSSLVAVSFFAGIILGIRFTELPIIVALLAFLLVRSRKLKILILTPLAFTAGILMWVIPLVVITGPGQFLSSYGWIANYVIRHDTLAGAQSISANFLFSRLDSLWYLLNIGYTQFFLVLASLSLFIIFLQRRCWRELRYQFLIVWLLSYTIPLVFVYNLEVTRYTLPLAPPLAIVTASLLTVLRTKVRVSFAAFLISITAIILGQEGLSQVKQFHGTIPPTIAPVQFVKENFNAETTAVVSTSTYRQFQYYAPDFHVLKGDFINKIPNLTQYDTVILDYLGLKDQNDELASFFEVSQKIDFVANPRVFTRLPTVTLYILKNPL